MTNSRIVIESGTKYGLWTVLSRDEKRSDDTGVTYIRCVCDCGNTNSVRASCLKNGRSSACAMCSKSHQYRSELTGRPIRMPKPVKDEAGKRYGKLLVTNRAANVSGSSAAYWNCTCDCGVSLRVLGIKLRRGKARSCGCAIRLPQFAAAINHLVHRYASAAIKRGLEFSLTRDECIKLFSSSCYYCVVEAKKPYLPAGCKMNGTLMYNGIDRVDNSGGYTTDNCVSCCSKCNYAKGRLTIEDFLNVCVRVANKHGHNTATSAA